MFHVKHWPPLCPPQSLEKRHPQSIRHEIQRHPTQSPGPPRATGSRRPIPPPHQLPHHQPHHPPLISDTQRPFKQKRPQRCAGCPTTASFRHCARGSGRHTDMCPLRPLEPFTATLTHRHATMQHPQVISRQQTSQRRSWTRLFLTKSRPTDLTQRHCT